VKALTIVPRGAAGAYELRDVPEPAIGARELLVRVRATALNRADVAQRAGGYRQQATAREGVAIAGLEAAGEVVAVGDEVTLHRVGDRVMGMCSGGFAEYLALDERIALPVPAALDWPQAAATPVGLMTEHDAIATRAQLRPGESLLLHAAGSGVGLMGVQIAKLLGARPLLATVGAGRKAEVVRELGADVTIDHRGQDFEAIVAEHTDGGVEIVIDHVGAKLGAKLLDANLRALAVGGRLVSVGRLGERVGEIDLDLLAKKNLQLIGTSFRTRTIAQYGEVAQRAAAALLPALADGRLRPLVDSVFPLEEAEAAQERMLANQHVGKIVLDVGEALDA